MNHTPSLSCCTTITTYTTCAGLLEVHSTHEGIIQTRFVTTAQTPVQELTVQHEALLSHLILEGTPFQTTVWQALLTIPAGTTISYQELAKMIGKPKAHRAVARAVATNTIAYFIPCHRVIRADGSLGGFRWGVERKKALLEYEKGLKKE